MNKEMLVIEEKSVITDKLKQILCNEGYKIYGPVILIEQTLKMSDYKFNGIILIDIENDIHGIRIHSAVKMYYLYGIPSVFITNDHSFNGSNIKGCFGTIYKPFCKNDFISKIDIAFQKKYSDGLVNTVSFLCDQINLIKTEINYFRSKTLSILQEKNDTKRIDSAEKLLLITDKIQTILNISMDAAGMKFQLKTSEINFNVRLSVDNVIKEFEYAGINIPFSFSPLVPDFINADPSAFKEILSCFFELLITYRYSIDSQCDIIEDEFPFQKIKIKNRIKKEFEFERFLKGLQVCSEIAAKKNIKLCLSENEYGTFLELILACKTVKTKENKPCCDLNTFNLMFTGNFIDNEICKLLNDYKCNIRFLNNGKEALEFISESKKKNNITNIVILDDKMEDMDFKDFSKSVFKMTHGATKTVLVVDNGNKGDAKILKSYMFSAYLIRPLCAEELIECLKLVASEKQSTNKSDLITRHTIREINENKARVLFADDNVVNQSLVGLLLRKKGFIYDVVSNGVEVLAALDYHKYDIIILDIQMPVMNGCETVEKIRSLNNQNRNIPVLALTGENISDETVVQKFDHILNKPIESEKLFSIIYKLLPQQKESTTYDFWPIETISDCISINKTLVGEMIENLIIIIKNKIPSIINCASNGNYQTVKNEIHNLKGTAANLRIWPLFSILEKWEEIEIESDLNELEKQLIDIVEKLECFYGLKPYNLISNIQEKILLPEENVDELLKILQTGDFVELKNALLKIKDSGLISEHIFESLTTMIKRCQFDEFEKILNNHYEDSKLWK